MQTHNNETTQAAQPRPTSNPVDDMLAEGGGVVMPAVDVEQPLSEDEDDARDRPSGWQSELEVPATRVQKWLEDFSQKWGAQKLKTLVARQGRLSHSLGGVPRNMHRVANQTQLILELLDDFRDGTYRKISWRSVALLAGAVLYTVSPADVIPDALPFVGQFDDLAILTLVTRFLNKDLRDYCEFKGYDVQEYFRAA